MLTAEDEFFKSVAYRGDINRQAYAIAAKEGLPAEQMHARIAELSANPTEEMIANAKKVAEYQTFQTPLGKSAARSRTSPTATSWQSWSFPSFGRRSTC
jgi:hypothetical protein